MFWWPRQLLPGLQHPCCAPFPGRSVHVQAVRLLALPLWLMGRSRAESGLVADFACAMGPCGRRMQCSGRRGLAPTSGGLLCAHIQHC